MKLGQNRRRVLSRFGAEVISTCRLTAKGFMGNSCRSASARRQHASRPECPLHEHTQESFQFRLSRAAFQDSDSSGNGLQSAKILVARLCPQAVLRRSSRWQLDMPDADQAWLATHEFFGLPPTRIWHDQVHRLRETGREIGGQFNGHRTGIEQERGPSRLNQSFSRHPFVASAINADFAVRQRLGRQSRRVGRQHFLTGVHENDHASLKCKLRNHRAEAKRLADLAVRAAVCSKDRSHLSSSWLERPGPGIILTGKLSR